MKRLLLFAVALGLWSSQGWGQVSFVSAVDGLNNGGTTNSLTFNFTVSAGSNPILFVPLVGDNNAVNDDITSVKYNGVSMTLVAKVLVGAFGSVQDRNAYLYYLVGPSTGTNSVVITCTANHWLIAGAGEWDGVSPTGQLDATVTKGTSAAASTLTTSITTVADNSWVVLMEEGYNSNPCPTAGVGDTRRSCAAAFGNWGLFDSNGAIHPAGSYSMTTNRSSVSNAIIHILASVKPAAAASTPVGFNKRQKLCKLDEGMC